MTLGEKLRKLRLEKGMTLQDVAERTGYSKALISRIENDSVSPSISSLVKITSALDIRLNELFAAIGSNPAALVRKDGRGMQMHGDGKISVENLCYGSEEMKMDALIETFEPGADREGSTATAEEWRYVLKGRFEAVVDGVNYELKEGDSIYLSSGIISKWRNAGKSKASALVVSTSAAS